MWLWYHFERKILGSWIAIWDISKVIFCSIATYYYCYSLSVTYRYGNLFWPIPIMIRHFPYWQNRYISWYGYRYCISRTLPLLGHLLKKIISFTYNKSLVNKSLQWDSFLKGSIRPRFAWFWDNNIKNTIYLHLQ